MKARVKVPGTCGELVQGTLAGVNFHITCPIAFFSDLTVEIIANKPGIIFPKGFEKSARAVELTLKALMINQWGATITVNNSLPAGKGMASSTADITAACYATACAVGREITPDQVAGIALAIEPSDGIMFPGLHLFDHVRGRISQGLGQVRGLGILMIDLGGQVDTVAFNTRKDLVEANRAKEEVVMEALNLVREGLKTGKLELVGKGATLSSRANQSILMKKELPRLEELVDKLGLLGVNVAHSGTVAGLLFEMERVNGVELEERVRRELGSGFNYYLTSVTGGGPLVVEAMKGEKPWKEFSISTEVTSEPLLSSLG